MMSPALPAHHREQAHGLALVAGGLSAAMASGFINEQPVAPLAHLILAAVNEAGLVIARSDDVAAARTEVGQALMRVLEGLRSQ
jgi:tetracycline repressor-like protein